MIKFLEEAQKFEIQPYKAAKDPEKLKAASLPFSGSPVKHHHDPERIILIADPYADHTHYIEFRTQDILFVEEMPSIINMSGRHVHMARIWVRKGAVGIRCTPFVAADIVSRS
ncbi:MAG: inorganic pyrophosphatase Ppa [Desulfobacterales bacterium]|nr:MAG: inorganic pyrophosphatase Ppa [Desulfobacterales bacterium]